MIGEEKMSPIERFNDLARRIGRPELEVSGAMHAFQFTDRIMEMVVAIAEHVPQIASVSEHQNGGVPGKTG